MDIDLEIQKSLEYLKYAIEQIVEKNIFYYHSKVHFKKDNYFKSGDKLLIENPLSKLGVGKIFFEDDNYFFTRQFNGIQYSKEEYFTNKEHSDMVKNGLYNKPYYGNKQLYKAISTNEIKWINQEDIDEKYGYIDQFRDFIIGEILKK